jgi:hypothetical protein
MTLIKDGEDLQRKFIVGCGPKAEVTKARLEVDRGPKRAEGLEFQAIQGQGLAQPKSQDDRTSPRLDRNGRSLKQLTTTKKVLETMTCRARSDKRMGTRRLDMRILSTTWDNSVGTKSHLGRKYSASTTRADRRIRMCPLSKKKESLIKSRPTPTKILRPEEILVMTHAMIIALTSD